MIEVHLAKFHPPESTLASRESLQSFLEAIVEAAEKGATRANVPADFEREVVVVQEDRSVTFLLRWTAPIQDVAVQVVSDAMVQAARAQGASVGTVTWRP